MADITYYKTDEIPPIDSITWDQLITYLEAGYDPRFCSTLDAAKGNINNGTTGDALAVFESFPHFIFKLNKESKIRVEDNSPFKHEIRKEIHKHMYATLDSYLAALGDSTKMKTAWDAVLSVLSPANGFDDTAKTTICKEFYDSLTKYVIQCGTLDKQTALVLVKACPKMKYYDEGMYGRFAKRGSKFYEPSQFSRQIWTASLDITDQNLLEKRIKQAVHAILYMAHKAQ